MNIKRLFELYEAAIASSPNILEAFDKSEMTNTYAKLDFGFFPLGSGVFTQNSMVETASLERCDVMVLGNDFGNVAYVEKQCPDNREKATNPTIKNLAKLGLDNQTTFYTNYFPGLRKGAEMVGVKSLDQPYVAFCAQFFKTQLDFLKPKIVLCLGEEVKQALTASETAFAHLSAKTITRLYEDPEATDFVVVFEGITFIFIPHPSYAHLNWSKNNIEQRIVAALAGSR